MDNEGWNLEHLAAGVYSLMHDSTRQEAVCIHITPASDKHFGFYVPLAYSKKTDSMVPVVRWSERKQLSLDHRIDTDKRYEAVAWQLEHYPNIICLDVDGKNGGFKSFVDLIKQYPEWDLHTYKHISKSRNGFHLFFSVKDKPDCRSIIGFREGIDVISKGIVYDCTSLVEINPCTELPSALEDEMHDRVSARRVTKVYSSEDVMIPLTAVDCATAGCNHKVSEGKRNSTVFKKCLWLERMTYEWEDHLEHMCKNYGLDYSEQEALRQSIQEQIRKDGL